MENRPLEVSIQDGVILMVIQGELTGERLPLLEEDIKKANAFIREESEKASRPLPILIDLTELSGTYDPSAMLLLANLEKVDRPYVTKTLCFGANPTIKFAGEIISALSSRENITFLKTKEEALAALKEGA
ncbi:MAG: hypothetical protein B7W98_02810 [Parcubacteria group bacterium 20-58-5]|nr:MAG: hypothetical protein B7W98_02810 [Parcubacteria group bacterium 20-58-5]OYV63822.1 MAG: hypothetical protein B7X03_00075 [Parcubacteria group bacterium 21-58-10]HQT82877.1 hypothetical protein [Candidatus Paceibacterota bacterium]